MKWEGGGGGGNSASFIWGGSTLKPKSLPFYIPFLTEKVALSIALTSIDK